MSKSPPMQPTTQPAPNQRRPASVSGWLGGAETEEELPFSSSVLHYGGRPFLFEPILTGIHLCGTCSGHEN